MVCSCGNGGSMFPETWRTAERLHGATALKDNIYNGELSRG